MTNKKKILFVCDLNEIRSPTAENLMKENPNIITKSAGILPNAKTQITKQAIDWADKIYVMEKFQKDAICEMFEIEDKEIIILNVPKTIFDEELEFVLRKKLDELDSLGVKN